MSTTTAATFFNLSVAMRASRRPNQNRSIKLDLHVPHHLRYGPSLLSRVASSHVCFRFFSIFAAPRSYSCSPAIHLMSSVTCCVGLLKKVSIWLLLARMWHMHTGDRESKIVPHCHSTLLPLLLVLVLCSCLKYLWADYVKSHANESHFDIIYGLIPEAMMSSSAATTDKTPTLFDWTGLGDVRR